MKEADLRSEVILHTLGLVISGEGRGRDEQEWGGVKASMYIAGGEEYSDAAVQYASRVANAPYDGYGMRML